MASRATRVKKGYHVGGVPPYGHRSEPQPGGGAKLVVEETEQAILERAATLLVDERRSPKETAELLNAEGWTKRGRRWTSSSLIHALSNSTVGGRFVYGKEKRARTKFDAERFGIKGLEVEVDAVLDRERWQAVQDLLARVKWTKRTSHTYPLSKRLLTEDGHAYVGRWDTRAKVRKYRCGDRYHPTHPADCSHCEVYADKIEAAVWWALEDQLRTMDGFYAMLDELMVEAPTSAEAAQKTIDHHSARVRTLRGQRVEVEARGLRDGFSKAAIQAALDEIDADVRTEEAELRDAEAWAENARLLAERRKVLASWEAFDTLFSNPDLKDVKALYEALDLTVVIRDDGSADVKLGLPLDRGIEHLHEQYV